MLAGSRRTTAAIAACTSCAAASISRSSVNCKVVLVLPRELEEVLFSHPAVANAAVVGKRDVAVGELPIAFVVLADEAVDPAEIREWVNERVTPYKKLRDIRVLDEIPVSAAGKVLRRELRTRIEQEG